MEEKYIVVNGDVEMNNNNFYQVANKCCICNTWDYASEKAKQFILNGSLTVQIYKLEAFFNIENVTVIRRDSKEDVILLEK
jgi:hypothetical protein